MSDDVEVHMAQALIDRAKQLAATLGLDIAFPTVPFTQPPVTAANATYLEIDDFPNTPIRVGNRTNRHRGVFQVELVTPLVSASIPATRLAGKIREHFKAGTWLPHEGLTVRVELSWVGGGYRGRDAEGKNDGRWRVPVSVRWFCDVQI